MEAIITTLISKINSSTNLKELAEQFLWNLAKETNCTQGAFYVATGSTLKFIEGYAFHLTENENLDIEIGEGITGQVGKDGKYINITNVPNGYLTVLSGLGTSSPTNLLVYPFQKNGKVIAVIELASFAVIEGEQIAALSKLNDILTEQIIKFS
jgi:putative methionine-R-sulfoxide reductase with GAF domain